MKVIYLTDKKKELIIEEYKRKVSNGETALYQHSDRKLYTYPEGIDKKWIPNQGGGSLDALMGLKRPFKKE